MNAHVDAAGIYVHVPFCLTRCGYCDFNAYAGLDHLASRYVSALLREAELAAPAWEGEEIVSVFLGGGTPTTLEVADLKALLARLRSSFAVTFDAEVTIEANPDTVDEQRLTGLREAGYGRLSIGAQSFDRSVLAALERVHQPEVGAPSASAARAAGFENVSLDLIYGAAGESVESWERTLREAITLSPEHVSAYALTIEPATALGRQVARGRTSRRPIPTSRPTCSKRPAVCSATRATATTRSRTGRKPGYECRHNLGYWERRPYVGLGAGAHGYRDGRRWWNVRPPEEYLSMVERGELPVGGSEELEPADAYLEEVFLRLRILQGIPASWIEDGRADPYLESGLLLDDDGNLVPTERGMLLLNELVLGLTG